MLALVLTAPEAEAGWFSWLWRDSRQEELQHALRAANQTVHTAGQLVESQSRQAAAQAEQNSRVASLLGELAQERQRFTSQVTRLEAASRRESVLAAAVLATAPALVSGTALLLGSLAIWAVTRSGASDADTNAALIELLVAQRPAEKALGKQAVKATAKPGMHRPRFDRSGNRLGEESAPRRLPKPVRPEDTEPPF